MVSSVVVETEEEKMPLSKKRDRERKRLLRLESGTNAGYCQVCNRYGVVDRHHKDLNHNNDESSNLMLLCPNCHADIHRNYVPSKLRSAGIKLEGNRIISVQPKSNLSSNTDVQPIPIYNPYDHYNDNIR